MLETSIKRIEDIVQGIPFVFIGSGFLRTWVRYTLSFLPEEPLGSLATSNMLFDGICATVYLVFAFAAQRSLPLFSNRRFLWSASISMALASLLICSRLPTLYPPLMIIALILGGCGFVTHSLGWVTFYAQFSPARAVLYFCAGRLFSEAFSFIFNGFIASYLCAGLTILPFLSALFLLRCSNHSESINALDEKSISRPFPLKVILFVASYSLAYAIADSATNSLSHYPEKLLFAIPPLIFFLSITLNPRYFSLKTVYATLCPLMMCALLLPPALPFFSRDFATIFIAISNNTADIVTFLILGSLSYRLGLSSLWLFGIVRTFKYLFLVGGAFLYRGLVPTEGSMPLALEVVLAILVTFATILLVTEKNVNSNWSIPVVTTSSAQNVESHDAIAQLKTLFNLTDREEEILYMLAAKKTVPTIARDMFLAQGTVKAHIQHIYQKTGVHSRKELFTLLHIR